MDDVDEGFDVLHGGVGQHAVAQVEDVAGAAAGASQDVAGPLLNVGRLGQGNLTQPQPRQADLLLQSHQLGVGCLGAGEMFETRVKVSPAEFDVRKEKCASGCCGGISSPMRSRR